MEELPALARALTTGGRRYVFACTAGLGGPALLLATPGASAAVLEVTSPYTRRAFLDYTAPQPPPASFASADGALCLARSSLRRATALAVAERGLGGALGCTGVGVAGALASLEPKAGPHRCHVALCSEAGEEVWTLLLDKGRRGRAREDELCGAAALGAAASAAALLPEGGMQGLLARCGFGGALGFPGDALTHAGAGALPLLPPLQRLAGGGGAGPPRSVLFTSPTQCLLDAPLAALPRPLLVLPGSFNPLHRGHLAMASAALRCLRPPPAQAAAAAAFTPTLLFELSMENVDKPLLGEAEVQRRVDAFFTPEGLLGGGGHAALPELQRAGVLVTRAPRFIDKAALCGSSTAFVCGFDTAARLIMPEYYAGGQEEMEGALGGMLAGGCRVVVGGRRAGAAPLPRGWAGPTPSSPEEFLTLGQHLLPHLPRALHELFVEIPQAHFHVDVSSRDIREAAKRSGDTSFYT